MTKHSSGLPFLCIECIQLNFLKPYFGKPAIYSHIYLEKKIATEMFFLSLNYWIAKSKVFKYVLM